MRNIVLSAGGIDSLSCQESYRLSRIERLIFMSDRSENMDRGTLVHYLLEEYYNAIIKDPQVDRLSLIEDCIHKGNIRCTTLAIPDDLRAVIFKSFREYALHYKADWEPIAVETPVSKVILEDEELDFRVTLEGRIDLVAKVGDLHYVIDHKSVEQDKKSNYPRRSNQFLLYSWATGLSNVIVNIFGIQKTKPAAEKFRRVTHSYMSWDIDSWVEYVQLQSVRLLKAIENNYYEKNFEQCKWCQFQAICDASPARKEHVMETQYKINPRYDLYGS